jgi:hypothetical protein
MRKNGVFQSQLCVLFVFLTFFIAKTPGNMWGVGSVCRQAALPQASPVRTESGSARRLSSFSGAAA